MKKIAYPELGYHRWLIGRNNQSKNHQFNAIFLAGTTFFFRYISRYHNLTLPLHCMRTLYFMFTTVRLAEICPPILICNIYFLNNLLIEIKADSKEQYNLSSQTRDTTKINACVQICLRTDTIASSFFGQIDSLLVVIIK